MEVKEIQEIVLKTNVKTQTKTAKMEVKEIQEIVLKTNVKTQTKTAIHTEISKFLKAHQVDGIKFMYENCYVQNSGCILAHCMGLGKTLQVIALLQSVISVKEYSTNKILVLCPLSTISNWKEEISRWLAPINDQRTLQIYELEQKHDINQKISYLQKWSQCGRNAPAACLIMGYEAFRNLVNFHSTKANTKKYKASQLREIRQLIEKHLIKGPDIVICDEGHIIKNLDAGITLAVNQIQTRKRIILTGTPMQNHLMEYYSMINFVKPSFLGTRQDFNEYFAEPIKDGQHADSCQADIKYMKERSYALNKKLSKIVQRREISLLKDFLPEKFEFVLFVPLTGIQYKLYKYFLDNRGGLIESKRLFGDYTCLRKIWTHPNVLYNAHQKAVVKKKKASNCDDNSCSDDDDEDQLGGLDSIDNDWWRKVINNSQLESVLSSHKVVILFEILKECKRVGEKCVIFSSFVQVLNVVEFFMNEINQQQKDGNLRPGLSNFVGPWIKNEDYYRLDGSVPKERRHTMIKSFNDENNKRTKVFLISAKAGSLGINLIGANRLILLDTSWNPAQDQQSIFRIYRMGQTRHCYIYRLLSMGTMEEKIYSRSVTKQAMSCRVVDKQQVDRHYSMDELYELYSLTKAKMEKLPQPILPKDDLLAQLLLKHPDKIYKYLEHDSLLENKVEEELNDVEKNEAWQRFERNSQSQSLLVTSVELEPQITSSSQNPTIRLAVKSQNKMESNNFELEKPVAVPMGPKPYNSLKDNSLGTAMDTISNSPISSNDPFVQMNEEFSEGLIDGRENAGVDPDSENANISLNELLGNEEFSQELIGAGQVSDDVLVQNAQVDTYSKNATGSLIEPSDDMNDEFSQEVIGRQVIDDVLVQNAQVDKDLENATNFFEELFANDVMNEECLDELRERQISTFAQGMEIETSREYMNAELQEFDKEHVGMRTSNSLSTITEGIETSTEHMNVELQEVGKEEVGTAKSLSVFAEGIETATVSIHAEHQEFDKDNIGMRTANSVSTFAEAIEKSREYMNAELQEFDKENVGMRTANSLSTIAEGIETSTESLKAKHQEFDKKEVVKRTANSLSVCAGGIEMSTESMNAEHQEFDKENIGMRTANSLSTFAEGIETSTESMKAGHQEFDKEEVVKRTANSLSVCAEGIEMSTESMNAEHQEFDKENVGMRTADSLSTFAEGIETSRESMNAELQEFDNENVRMRTANSPPTFEEGIETSRESMNAELQDFDQEDVGMRTVDSLSTVVEDLLQTLNVRYAVPLQQCQQQNVLNTIDNYSREQHINAFNRFNTFEYKITFKRPLNSNDQQPVKRLKLSLEIDSTAAQTVDQALSTLINDRTLTPTGEESTSASMRLMNYLGNSSAEDVEMNSNCIQESTIIKDNIKDLVPNYMQFAPDSFVDDTSAGDEEILKKSNDEQEPLLPFDKRESAAENTSEDERDLENYFEGHSRQEVDKELFHVHEASNSSNDQQSIAPDSFVDDTSAGDEQILKNVAHNEQESLLPCDKHESVVWKEVAAETSSEDERDLENYFEGHSRQEVYVEASKKSNEQHSILATMKRTCVLM